MTKAPDAPTVTGDATYTFAAFTGSKMKWTGVSNSLILPPKGYTAAPTTYENPAFALPYDTKKWSKMGGTGQPAWNDGY